MCSKQRIFSFQKQLLHWYAVHGRDLPWRKTTNAYHIALSELMLQQTQVSRVIKKYALFTEKYNKPEQLLSAPLSEVLFDWQGLGYNRRALYARNVALLCAQTSKPSFEQLLEVKGIGTYSAAAICIFAYNHDRAAIDVNVRRVLSRVFGAVSDAFIATLVPVGKSRDWHNALMDFGSVVCTKKNPSCATCIFKESCTAVNQGLLSSEKTLSQKKFLGSVRWHRGQILKQLVLYPHTHEKLFTMLEPRYRTKKAYEEALNQLIQESFLERVQDKYRIKE